MNQSPMGWYEDDDAPGLARWWDGDRWTEHTMVIPADQAGMAADAPTAVTPALGDDLDDEDVLHHFSRPADGEPLPPRTGPTRFPRVDEPIPATAAARAAAPLDLTDVGTFEFGALGELDTADNAFFAPEPELDPGVYRPDWLGTMRRRIVAGVAAPTGPRIASRAGTVAGRSGPGSPCPRWRSC